MHFLKEVQSSLHKSSVSVGFDVVGLSVAGCKVAGLFVGRRVVDVNAVGLSVVGFGVVGLSVGLNVGSGVEGSDTLSSKTPSCC
jgi:hypothetical protein